MAAVRSLSLLEPAVPALPRTSPGSSSSCDRESCGKLLRFEIGVFVMAQKCDLCGKGPQFGNNVSHANNTTRRRWNVNLQPVKAKVNGASKRMRVCTSCIKTGKVVKG